MQPTRGGEGRCNQCPPLPQATHLDRKQIDRRHGKSQRHIASKDDGVIGMCVCDDGKQPHQEMVSPPHRLVL